jgi:hypothetical protein
MTASLGKVAFDAYNEARGGKTHDGKPTPPWESLGDGIQTAWERAAHAAVRFEIEPLARAGLVQRGYWDVFEATAKAIGAPTGRGRVREHLDSGFGFGLALHYLRAGRRVAREGWNGKAMWVALTPGSTVPVGKAHAGAASHRAAELIRGAPDLYAAEGQKLTILPHLDMRAADGSLVIGWLASQTDILAEDWMVLEDSAAVHTGQILAPDFGGHTFVGPHRDAPCVNCGAAKSTWIEQGDRCPRPVVTGTPDL